MEESVAVEGDKLQERKKDRHVPKTLPIGGYLLTGSLVSSLSSFTGEPVTATNILFGPQEIVSLSISGGPKAVSCHRPVRQPSTDDHR